MLANGVGVGVPFTPLGRVSPASSTAVLNGFFTSFWKVADLSDSIGSNTLTNSASPVTFSAGKIGNAGNFVAASSQVLSRANVSITGPKFTFTAWFKTTASYTANAYVVGYGPNTPTGGANVQINGASADGKIRFYTFNGGGLCLSASAYNDANWHLLVAYSQGTGGSNFLIIDNGTPVSNTGATNVTGTMTFSIGAFNGSSLFWNGMIDAVGIADNKTPTAAQITAMWNGGAGAEPPF